jgi:hypothetical protein
MFAMVAAGVGAASTAYAADPPDPATAQAVAQWVTGSGAADLKALGADFTELEAAANAADMPRMGAGCDALLVDVQAAQAHEPIPDALAEKDWANALSLYEQGAADCAKGAKTQDFSLIADASDEIIKGSADLDNVTARLKIISGN